MYLSPYEVAETREQTLNNFISASTAYVEAGGRLSSLFMRAGRDAIVFGSRHFDLLSTPAALTSPAQTWQEGLPGAPAKLVEEAFDILGDTHMAIIKAVEAQVRIFDRILFSVMDRAKKSSPWEGEIALAVMKNTLRGAENTLHEVADAAIQTVEQAELQMKQVAETLAEPALPEAVKPAPRRSRAKSA